MRARMRHEFPRIAGPALAALLLAALAGPVRSVEFTEYELKAAFLYQFALYVSWPDDGAPGEAFGIGVVGQDPFGQTIDSAMRGKSVHGHPVRVRRFEHAADVDSCRIVFVGEAEDAQARTLLKRIGGRPVLTVGETPQFLDEGGIVRFRVERGRVRIVVDTSAAAQSELRISSRLLSVSDVRSRKAKR